MKEALTSADGASNGDLVAGTRPEKGLRAMTIKERLQIHRRIEAENKRKLKEWKEGKAA